MQQPVEQHDMIVCPPGYIMLLAKIYNVSVPSVCRYLKGQFRDSNKNLSLILQIRAHAARLRDGVMLWVCRERSGKVFAFTKMPTRDVLRGEWYCDYKDAVAMEFPELLLPEGVEPEWGDAQAIRVKIVKA